MSEKFDPTLIIQKPLSTDQYYQQENDKHIICLHHTVSGPGIDGDFLTWQSNKERVATALILDRKGDVYQCFKTKHWAHHLGITPGVFQKFHFADLYTRNDKLNWWSIGIELDNWGGLVKDSKGVWYPALLQGNKFVPNLKCKPIPKEQVQEYPKGFRGFYGFEKYSPEQLEKLRQLLHYLCDSYKIRKRYNEDMWDVSETALNGIQGIWTHVSFRYDKSDCHPQPELIQMLKNLESET